jgi:hypothetical protein
LHSEPKHQIRTHRRRRDYYRAIGLPLKIPESVRERSTAMDVAELSEAIADAGMADEAAGSLLV